MRAAASRTFCTAGNSKASKTPTMAITTSNSRSVNAAPAHFRSPGASNERGGIMEVALSEMGSYLPDRQVFL